MQVTLNLILETELYDISEWRRVEQMAKDTGKQIYTWKTTGLSNWLEQVISNVDSLGLVLLPDGLPDRIEMMDDEPEED